MSNRLDYTREDNDIIGARCFFNWKHGIHQFGRIIAVDYDNRKIKIYADDNMIYSARIQDVIVL